MARDNWDFYRCNVNDNLSSIFTNLALVEVAPIRGLPVLHWLWIKLQCPDDRGLSTDQEFDRLCGYQDELELALSDSDDIIFVGRITGAGRREYYFYSSPNVKFQERIDAVLSSYSEYPFQIGSRLDEEWNQYLGLLYPGDYGIKQIRNRREESRTAASGRK